MTTQVRAQLKERIAHLPLSPGVYLFEDEKGEVIYIGKAARLRTRVRSYFSGKGSESPWTRVMTEKIRDLEYITTDSDREALILETHLIKEHRPRFNILMRDDKSYLYLKITLRDELPRVTTTRRIEADGARYFGPFPSGEQGVRQLFRYLRLIFPFRTALERPEKMLQQPALDYYVKRFGGSYDKGLEPEIYQGIISQIVQFLEGRYAPVIRDLQQRMKEASESQDFELAAKLRDQLRTIERLAEEQKVATPTRNDMDVVGFFSERGRASVNLFSVREGKLLRRARFLLELPEGQQGNEALAEFLERHYAQAAEIPREIVLSERPAREEELGANLRELAERAVKVSVPGRGFKRKLAVLSARNAEEHLRAESARWLADEERLETARRELARALGITTDLPRIECYDISNIGGEAAVGSMAVFIKGKPASRLYRRFRIRTVEGIDDYRMMQEVLGRRLGRTSGTEVPQDESFQEHPDLIIIDGGKGQVSAAKRILTERGSEIPIIGLAKREEEIFIPLAKGFRRVLLPPRSEALYLVQRIRDEAHRFAQSYHHAIRRKSVRGSLLEEVPGVGPATRKKLIRRFGSAAGVRAASEAELSEVIGAGKARVVKRSL